MFDAIAGRYDLLNHLLSAGIDRVWRRRAIRALALSGSERLLDLCTGTADVAIEARTAVPAAARVVGVDFARAMLKVGRKKVQQNRFDDTISLVCGDATSLPVATASVDAVTIAFGIRNVERPEAACDEIHRVLRPGGRLAVLGLPHLFPARASAYWPAALSAQRGLRLFACLGGCLATPDEFEKILKNHQFVQVRADPLTLGIVFLYTARKR